MGKGTIFDGGAKGKYNVVVDYGIEIKTTRLAQKTARKASVESQITTVEDAIEEIEIGIDGDIAAIDAAIDVYNASEKTTEDKERLEEKTLRPILRKLDLRRNKLALGQLQLELTGIDADISMLNSVSATELKTVWCADYTEDASGSVSLIEINAEPPTIVIAPGGAPYSAQADGKMVAREFQEGYQVYFNAAILPGVQKWKPTYRSGVITGLDQDNHLCAIDLDPAQSSAQDLDINQVETLSAVPIEYMNCDSYAFEDGDKVVIKFQGQDQSNPVVIGFVTNPRPCGASEVWFIVEASSYVVDPPRPRGRKWMGWPFTAGDFYSPEPGYNRYTGANWGTEICHGSPNISTPQETWADQGDADPAELTGRYTNLRIRFDISWEKEFLLAPYFEPTFPSLEIIEIDGAATTDVVYEMPCDFDSVLPNGGVFQSRGRGGLVGGWRGEYSWDVSPRWVTAKESTAPWGFTTYLNYNYFEEPEMPIWYGQEPDIPTGYDLQGWSGYSWDRTFRETANNLEHCSEFFLQAYTPPQEIVLTRDSINYKYEFVRIGGAPKSTEFARSVPQTVPPGEVYSFDYATNGERCMAVVYRFVEIV